MYSILQNVRTERGLRQVVVNGLGETERVFASFAKAEAYRDARNAGYCEHVADFRAGFAWSGDGRVCAHAS